MTKISAAALSLALPAMSVFVIASAAFVAPEAAAADFAFITTTDYSTGSSSVIWLDASHTEESNVASVYSDAVSRYYNGLVYVVNRYGGDNIQILDPANNFATVRQFSVGSGSDPHDIAFVNETKAYVSRYNTNDLWIVDPSTGAHTGTIDLSGLADADGICEMSRMIIVGGRLFVAVQRLDRNNYWLPATPSYIAVVDVSADTLIDTDPQTAGIQPITLSGTDPYSDIEFDPYTGRLFVSCVGTWGVADGGAELIDPTSMKSTGFMLTESSAGGDINDIEVLSADKGYAIVTDANFYNLLVAFDPATGALTDTLYAPQSYTLSDIEVSGGRELFCCDRSATEPGIRIYNTYTNSEETSNPIDVGLPPFQITFSKPIQTDASTPSVAYLEQNFPNPFNPSTTIPFAISKGSHVTLGIYDVNGRLVKRIISASLPAGSYRASWNGKNGRGAEAAAGVYIARLSSDGTVFTRKMVLVR